jgi:hypothetical protein
MLKHRALTLSRVADAETQRKPPRPTMLKLKGSHYSQSGQQECRHSQSAIHVAETTHELRC